MIDTDRLLNRYDSVHVAVPDRLDALTDELQWRGAVIAEVIDTLVCVHGFRGPAAWAQNSWLDVAEVEIESIGAAARMLKAVQRNWVFHPLAAHRRARLIADKLPPIRFRPLSFPADPPGAALGVFALRDRHRMLVASRTTSAFAHGQPTFEQDRRHPPNRAYLKLWEALTLARDRPGPGQHALDLGAAPGGWSWVLAALGATVTSIDRAPLAEPVASHPRITHRLGDAFALGVDDIGPCDWICSDVIAYPDRLRTLADYWCHACPGAGVILTVKCQGRIPFERLAAFYAIDGARLMHLAQNKHELTFFRLPDGGPSEAAGCRG